LEEKGYGTDNHEVLIVNREQVTIRGVLHVDSFDDQEIILDTDLGTLIVRGEDLHIKQLNLDDGSFSVEGLISGIQYTAGKAKGTKGKGLLDRLLR